MSANDEGERYAAPAPGVLELVLPSLRKTLLRVLGADDPDYEDMLQICLEKVLLTLTRETFRGDCSLHGWGALIARNVAIDVLRARGRERRLFVHDEQEVAAECHAPGPLPDHLAIAREGLTHFDDQLSALSTKSAHVVYLHGVLGYELAEVAAMIGLSVAAAQSRLARGRRAIADGMERKTMVRPAEILRAAPLAAARSQPAAESPSQENAGHEG